jgi:hypothetical protein
MLFFELSLKYNCSDNHPDKSKHNSDYVVQSREEEKSAGELRKFWLSYSSLMQKASDILNTNSKADHNSRLAICSRAQAARSAS